ncbi:16S rRNA (guanine(966)-N(2))-methyltransferase RsmD [Gottschalkia purinilytica]|uniref:16S rRNA (Guanine(966)-N(2))-methyltransferase RsmD n=1 Tax=Gottschalkia purinilytica TaxID=1503 RepID=A0A0L0WB98_GOTPU|nr:16S rRNA (guanine(966)-N(2))-methyltransferase RsmD [Gottschalkia purinilytica]
MRVITGKVRGFKLKSPKGLNTRPTSDRVKESIFNILGYISEDSIVLDLFSGSGNVGIEFLSRGAKKCYFIDGDANSIKVINENLKNTKFTDQAFIYKNNVSKAISILGKKSLKFDYIFMDPPYEKGYILPALENIYTENLLKKEGKIIIEHETKLELPNKHLSFIKIDTRKYGGTSVSFYTNEEVTE